MSRNVGPMIEALKISAPYRDFAVESEARSMGGTDRSRKALGFWMSSLENGNFKRLENRNVANFLNREFSCGPG